MADISCMMQVCLKLVACAQSQVDQRVFKQLMWRLLPALASHLEVLGGTDILDAVFAQWFLCAFVNALPMEV